MNNAVKLAYVIPTKDRPDDLRKMLGSTAIQTSMPEQIIVVDGSSPTIEHVLKEFPQLPLTYVRVFPPGLSKQRNAGMAALNDEITHAGYMDDDLVLEPEATATMVRFIQQAPAQLGGIAFSMINQPRAASPGLAKWFLVNHPQPGILMASGFQSQIPYLTQVTSTDWLYGGCTIWTRPVIREFQYDEWYIGTGYLEDVDYSYRVRQKYDLCVVGPAQLYHYSKPIPASRGRVIGKQQVVNRVYFFNKMKDGIVPFSKVALGWALFGQFLHNIAYSFKSRDRAGFLRAWGNIEGLIHLTRFGTQSVAGHFK